MSENQHTTLASDKGSASEKGPASAAAQAPALPAHPTDAQRPLLTDEQLAHLP